MTFLEGFIDLPWWGYILVVIGVGQFTFMAISLYLHRCQAHLSLELNPVLVHIFRFWLWFTSGMTTGGWVSIHRKHHAKCETVDDPHSPRVFGIRKLLLDGAGLYRDSDNPETFEKFGHGTPNDWLERNVYKGRSAWGVGSLLIIYFVLFGPIGITMWAFQMMWVPFFAAGVINGLGHYWGYRSYESADDATNLYPIAIWIAGEELHNNHHAYPSSAKFSIQPWEFDIGWMYITIFQFLGLAKVKKVAPKPIIDNTKKTIDLDTVKAIIRSKMHVMADYANGVIKPVLKDECMKADAASHKALKKLKSLLIREDSRINDQDRNKLDSALSSNKQINLVYQYRKQLLDIWNASYANQDGLLQAVIAWCKRAEASGIKVLQDFAASLKGYSLSAA